MWENVEINKPLRGERTELPEQTQKIMLEQGAPKSKFFHQHCFLANINDCIKIYSARVNNSSIASGLAM